MSRSPRATGGPRQRPLLFPVSDGPVEPWCGLAERQRLECRWALREMLVAVARHARGAGDGRPGSSDENQERSTHD